MAGEAHDQKGEKDIRHLSSLQWGECSVGDLHGELGGWVPNPPVCVCVCVCWW